jgi:hypothetical protein
VKTPSGACTAIHRASRGRERQLVGAVSCNRAADGGVDVVFTRRQYRFRLPVCVSHGFRGMARAHTPAHLFSRNSSFFHAEFRQRCMKTRQSRTKSSVIVSGTLSQVANTHTQGRVSHSAASHKRTPNKHQICHAKQRTTIAHSRRTPQWQLGLATSQHQTSRARGFNVIREQTRGTCKLFTGMRGVVGIPRGLAGKQDIVVGRDDWVCLACRCSRNHAHNVVDDLKTNQYNE